MNLNSPETWRWIWFAMAAIFAVSEMATPATFFFLPFAIGAAISGVLCIMGVSVIPAWISFLITSIIAFGLLWRLGRKLDQADVEQEGVGATRWVGQEAFVVEPIPEGGIGMVRLEREQWRAESLTGAAIRQGSTVVITRMAGTRLIVVPLDEPFDEISDHPLLKPNGSGSDPTQGVS